jgi:vitamin B12 transporter
MVAPLPGPKTASSVCARMLVVIAMGCGLKSGAASAQLSVSPDIQIPSVIVTAPSAPAPATRAPSGAASAVTASPPSTNAASVVISPTTVTTPTDQVANSVTVLTSQDIEQQQRRTATDALMTVPGINVVQTGGPGGVTSVFMRGTNSNHVKVLVDGIDVSDPSNPTRVFDFGQLLTADVAQIEVLRGPQSGLYGADALGGVIAITTKTGQGPPQITSTVEGGSFGTFNQSASASGSERNFNYALNISHLRATDTPVTPLALIPPGGVRNNDFYDNVSYSTKLGVDVTNNLAFNVVARYTDATLKFTGDNFSIFPPAPDASQSIQTVHQFYMRTEGVATLLGGAFKNYFDVGYTNDWNSTLSPSSPLASVNQGERIKYEWRGVVTLAPGQVMVMGLEDQVEHLDTGSVSAQEANRAAYLELQSEIAKRFFLAANIRVDDNEDFGEHTTWRIAPAFVIPGTETKLKASVGTAFKAPSLSQRFVDFPEFGFFANRHLQPEESLGYDFGFEQPFLDNRLRIGTTYFRNDIANLIATNDTFTTNINIGRATTSGTESFASLAVTQWFRLRADYTHTDAIDAITGLELLRRPKDKSSLTAAINPTDRWFVSATILDVSSWVDADRFGLTPRLTAPGYTIVNLAANYRVSENATLFGRIDNLLDRQYQDPTGFARPGIGVFVGLRLTH